VLFAVQGEGRGHMTQALAVAEMLRRAGHDVCGVLVGRSHFRPLPSFFVDGMAAPIISFESPTFVTKGHEAGFRVGATVGHIAAGLPRYASGFRTIHRTIRDLQPDLVVNFYEGLIGLYTAFARPEVPVVAVGHQFMFLHPTYRHAATRPVAAGFARFWTWLSSVGATSRLALSLYEAEDLPERGIEVVPPVLRDRVFDLAREATVSGDGQPYLLVYLLEAAMADGLKRWCEGNPHVRVHCFWDQSEEGEEVRHGENLTFHGLSGDRFLRMMAGAAGVVCTSGFESVSEAFLMGKPLLMVPVPNHFEQQWNAADAASLGAGLIGDGLDLTALVDYLPRHRPQQATFRAWTESAEAKVVGALERAAGFTRKRRATPRRSHAAPVSIEA
jgi:uncharacterized protein (TIGR00661 family)